MKLLKIACESIIESFSDTVELVFPCTDYHPEQ